MPSHEETWGDPGYLEEWWKEVFCQVKEVHLGDFVWEVKELKKALMAGHTSQRAGWVALFFRVPIKFDDPVDLYQFRPLFIFTDGEEWQAT